MRDKWRPDSKVSKACVTLLDRLEKECGEMLDEGLNC